MLLFYSISHLKHSGERIKNSKFEFNFKWVRRESKNIQHTIKRRKANWIGHILGRNSLLSHVIEGRMEG
jgi:hypothetical protein